MEAQLQLHRSVNGPVDRPLERARADRASLLDRYQRVRLVTQRLCEPLAIEDYVVQPTADVSPPKWHLAHSSWFFETFLLKAHSPHYLPFNLAYDKLFNSYYQTVGHPFPREKRGTLSRPTVEEVYEYRAEVDRAVLEFVCSCGDETLNVVAPILELGLQHEQQHQELLLTDIKYILWSNPLRPAYRSESRQAVLPTLRAELHLDNREPGHFRQVKGGLVEIGADESAPFSFDNEGPRHRVYLEDFSLQSALVTNEEYLEFMNHEGYRKPELWHSEGWALSQRERWAAPLYWEQDGDGSWWTMSFEGMVPVPMSEPVAHVSYYEASAFAAWKGQRLPTEFEWEHAAAAVSTQGNYLESAIFRPLTPEGRTAAPIAQLYGDLWEWTQSAYLPYPGFRALPGALGEYNGKFMCNQFVLRGGSCATPQSHVRQSYRNFFPPEARWQFSGFRLAQLASPRELLATGSAASDEQGSR